MYNYIRYCSPLGMLTVTEEDGALTALVIDGQKYAERHLTGEGTERETSVLHKARLWLDSYFSGEAPEVSGLPLSPKGTAFQKKVWQELLNIPTYMGEENDDEASDEEIQDEGPVQNDDDDFDLW